MQLKNSICVVVDRLHAGMLGAYGNSWIQTGQLDDLASESFLFDQAYLRNPQLERLYAAYWFGLHEGPTADAGAASFPRLLGDAGLLTALLTDEPDVSSLAWAADFSELLLVESPEATHAAEDVSETQLARLFSAAIEWLETPPEPFFLWIHARGMAAPWDAPWELRKAYAEDEDPDPPQFIEVPNRLLAEGFDPDELLGIVHAYAGQVSALDAVIGALCDHLRESPWAASTQLTFLSARGYPLGEHLRVGPCDDALYNEAAQLAWMMRFPDGWGKLARTQALVEPADLPGTLLDWLGISRDQLGTGKATSLLDLIRGDAESLRDRLFRGTSHERTIRTPAWLLRQPASGQVELYAKPGDRWEVNEVANLCPEIVAGLQAALAETAQAEQTAPAAPLAEALVRELD